MEKIIGMGNALVDLLTTLEDDSLLKEMQLPKGSMQLVDEDKYLNISDKVSSMKTRKVAGGSAGNTSKALAALGVEATFIGKTGDDSLSDFFAKDLKKHGVETHLLKVDMPTGVASTFILPDGERTFGTFLGAASDMKPEDLFLDMFKGYSYLYIEGYLVQDEDLILRAMQLAHEAGVRICLDLPSYNIVAENREFLASLIAKYVDIVFANEEEARAFTGKEAEEAVHELSLMASVAVVKRGAKGSYIKKGTELIEQGTPLVKKVVDTTGAGDYYAAGFLYGLTCGYSMEKCGNIASLLASTIIQVVGTTLTKRKWEEIKLNIDQLLHA